MKRNKLFPRGSILLLGVYAGILFMLLAVRLVQRFAESAAILSLVNFIPAVAAAPLSAMAVLCAVRYPGAPYLCLLGADLLWRIIDALEIWSTRDAPPYLSPSPLIRFLFNTLLVSLIPLGLTWLLSRGILRLTRREFPAFVLTSLVISLFNCWTLFFFIPEEPVKYLLYILLYTLIGFAVCVTVYGIAALIRRSRDKKTPPSASPDEPLGDYLS